MKQRKRPASAQKVQAAPAGSVLEDVLLLAAVLCHVLLLLLFNDLAPAMLRPILGSVSESPYQVDTVQAAAIFAGIMLEGFSSPAFPHLVPSAVLALAICAGLKPLVSAITSYEPAHQAIIGRIALSLPTIFLSASTLQTTFALLSNRGRQSQRRGLRVLRPLLLSLSMSVVKSIVPDFGFLPSELYLKSAGILLIGAIISMADSTITQSVTVKRHDLAAYSLQPFLLLILLTPYSMRISSTSTTPWPDPAAVPMLLAQNQSITGLISVVEWQLGEQWTRVMRADHSLLGGLWIGHARAGVMQKRQLSLDAIWESPEKTQLALENEAVASAESIYSTFYAQEAIRLVKRSDSSDPNALIIGLGAGISARALHLHGVEVTICEIDPVVYHLGRRFFDLPEPAGGLYLEDARATLRREGLGPYGYVIHDVFTGGSVPSLLFTSECWDGVKAVLKSDGVLAVNFAGLLHDQAGKSIFATLLHAFKYCRAFAERLDEEDETGHRNMVIFCSNGQDIEFRQPIEADFLQSGGRQRTLEGLIQNEIPLPDKTTYSSDLVLRDASAWKLTKWQAASVAEHIKVMRQVLPVEFWLFGT